MTQLNKVSKIANICILILRILVIIAIVFVLLGGLLALTIKDKINFVLTENAIMKLESDDPEISDIIKKSVGQTDDGVTVSESEKGLDISSAATTTISPSHLVAAAGTGVIYLVCYLIMLIYGGKLTKHLSTCETAFCDETLKLFKVFAITLLVSAFVPSLIADIVLANNPVASFITFNSVDIFSLVIGICLYFIVKYIILHGINLEKANVAYADEPKAEDEE